MKKLGAALVAVVAVASLGGCVAYAEPGYYGGGSGYREGGYAYRDQGYRGYRGDRDGDGVPNRYDRRPHNPYRY